MEFKTQHYDMTEEQLRSCLFRLSVKALHRLSSGTNDPIRIQGILERQSWESESICGVQIDGVFNYSDSEKDVTFSLAESFKSRHVRLTKDYRLEKLAWRFKLQRYCSGTAGTPPEFQQQMAQKQGEEGIVEWLTRGTVSIINVDKSTVELSTERFQIAVLDCDSY